MPAPHRNQLIASVATALQVLEALGESRQPLALSAIADRLGKPKGTVHRMLSTLAHTGFVAQGPDSARYRLTLKTWRLGVSALAGVELVAAARQPLDVLRQLSGETAHLAVLDESDQVMYLAKAESQRSILVQTRIGQLAPAWCTATGRCLLAFRPEVRERVLAGPLVPRTAKTVVDPRRLQQILATVRSRGHAVVKSESHIDMGGIAAPVRDAGGDVVAACCVAVPAFRMDAALVERCVPLVVAQAAAISQALGYRAA